MSVVLSCSSSVIRFPLRRRVVAAAKKRELPEEAAAPPVLPAKSLVVRSAIGVFALGFVDAGYSGDWTRIGAITRETEELLKAAAFLVVPFSLYLIFSLSRLPDGSGKA